MQNVNVHWLQAAFTSSLMDMTMHGWQSEVNTNALCVNYRIIKVKFGFETYLTRPYTQQSVILLDTEQETIDYLLSQVVVFLLAHYIIRVCQNYYYCFTLICIYCIVFN